MLRRCSGWNAGDYWVWSGAVDTSLALHGSGPQERRSIPLSAGTVDKKANNPGTGKNIMEVSYGQVRKRHDHGGQSQPGLQGAC